MPRHGPPGQPSFLRKSAPGTGAVRGEKTARLRRANGSPTRGLASDLSPDPQPHGGRDMRTDHWRFAGGKPGSCRHRQVCRGARSHRHEPPARETPAADRPPPWGIGRDAGATLRDAIQPLRLGWDGLEGAARPSMSIRHGSKGMTIGRGMAPERSHANLGTAGGEFA
jgi:hypothetical protein